MKIAPLRYFIDCHDLANLVNGYAVNFPLPERICVRRKSPWGAWVADHYDSGLALPGAWPTRHEAIHGALAIVRAAMADGRWQKAINSIEKKRW